MWMYDLTGGLRIGKLHERVSADEALAHLPTLPADRLLPSYLYYDARADDARLVPHRGPHRGPRVRRRGGQRCRGDRGRPRTTAGGSEGVDGRGRRAAPSRSRPTRWSTPPACGPTSVRAPRRARPPRHHPAGQGHPHHRAVAQGPQRHRRGDPGAGRQALGVRGARGATSPSSAPPTPTTTAPSTTRSARPTTSPTCCGALNAAITTEITVDDIVGTWAGLRPLVADPEPRAAPPTCRAATRSHRSDGGVVTITGGKLTTYREMAADTIDEVLDHVLDAGVLERVQRRSRTEAPAPPRRRRATTS